MIARKIEVFGEHGSVPDKGDVGVGESFGFDAMYASTDGYGKLAILEGPLTVGIAYNYRGQPYMDVSHPGKPGEFVLLTVIWGEQSGELLWYNPTPEILERVEGDEPEFSADYWEEALEKALDETGWNMDALPSAELILKHIIALDEKDSGD